jgi:hypothetical protein
MVLPIILSHSHGNCHTDLLEIESQVEVKRDMIISHYRYAIRSPVSRNINACFRRSDREGTRIVDAFPSIEADVLHGTHIKKAGARYQERGGEVFSASVQIVSILGQNGC